MPHSEFVPGNNPGPESPYHVEPASTRLIRAAALGWVGMLVLPVALLVYSIVARQWVLFVLALVVALVTVPLRLYQLRAARHELRSRRLAGGPPSRH